MAYETTDLGMYTELTIPGRLIGNKKRIATWKALEREKGVKNSQKGCLLFNLRMDGKQTVTTLRLMWMRSDITVANDALNFSQRHQSLELIS